MASALNLADRRWLAGQACLAIHDRKAGVVPLGSVGMLILLCMKTGSEIDRDANAGTGFCPGYHPPVVLVCPLCATLPVVIPAGQPVSIEKAVCRNRSEITSENSARMAPASRPLLINRNAHPVDDLMWGSACEAWY